jgi:hypothetical protein
MIAADTCCGVTCATADRVWGLTGAAACVAVEGGAGGGEGVVGAMLIVKPILGSGVT